MGRLAFEAHPVTKERWPDLIELFDRPVVRTCFCMYYRKTGTGTGVGLENRLVEAYPVDKDDRSHPDSMFFGAKSMYDRAGFREVARRKPTRPVVRKTLRPGRSATDHEPN